MNPTERSTQRFFSALVDICPVASVSHLYLCNQTINNNHYLISAMVKAGFTGTLVAARASIANGGLNLNPDLSVLLNDHPSNYEKS